MIANSYVTRRCSVLATVSVLILPIVASAQETRAEEPVTDDRDGHDVPFYLMPSIGGNSSVRGYPSFRFQDNHRLLFSAEYRWTAARFLDMALFYDAGKVMADLDQLHLRNLKSAVGVGARFHDRKRTVLRLELARNDEKAWRFVRSTGAAF